MLPPLPTTAPVSAETRLSYVLEHFRRAYADVPAVEIGSVGSSAAVQVAPGSGEFFAHTQPYPPAPNYRPWLGQSIPFFFDAAPDKPLLELLPDQRVIIHADVISAAFYLLSGWQEFYGEERDQHGRFPYAASVQHRYNFVTVPVVNYYFDVLKTAVEHASGQQLQLRRWPAEARWAAFVTHDIDNLYSAWKQPAKAALRAGNLLGFGRHVWQHLTKPDAWDNLAQVQAAVASYGAQSTFFFLPAHRPGANGTPNADYELAKVWAKLAPVIDGAAVGLHASIGRATHEADLRQEAQRVQHCAPREPVRGIRFHYLSWEPRLTPTLLDAVGFAYDTTLGFAEHFGFRNSYCHPFHLFDFHTGQAHRFLEIPLQVMDATLHHPNYLRLAPDEILPALRPMLQDIERFGGVFTLLWHNENFDPANQHNGPQQFHAIMDYLRSRTVAFVNGGEMVNE
ncbi:DUF7033 domain-containing protein [Hymenobacter chitinivorans]|uniref:DUF7033 domain-containing protein n=1 Tax=Hymenobacter chitinivorans DSM 11115 TaxID=1121954 RepID=A0A2M9BP68_9BACT|nr:hypothetical protein [Hymenobacter chitinivorans]PJJ59728.1 hypothetical protein CLV45_1150 [Hymenobacter chitinivorans DSM 11115]